MTVYQQQLLIKKLNEAVQCSDEENKKMKAEVVALTCAANEYKKLLEDNKPSLLSSNCSNNKRKSLFSLIYLIVIFIL